jgi:hypothetical protein
MRKSTLVGLLASIAAMAGVSAASSAMAQVTEYTSQSAFDTANPTAVAYSFYAGGVITPLDNPSTFNGVTFTDNTTAADLSNSEVPLMFLVDENDVSNYGADFLSFQNENTDISGVINPVGTYFFGFNYGSYIPIDGDATLTVNSDQVYTITPTATEGFIGFSSTAPITSITIDYPDSYAFDIVSYSTVSSAPEPAAWLMMVIGVGVVGAALRRRAYRPETGLDAGAMLSA